MTDDVGLSIASTEAITPVAGVSIIASTPSDALTEAAMWCAEHEDQAEVLDLACRIGGYERVGHPAAYQLRIYYRPA